MEDFLRSVKIVKNRIIEVPDILPDNFGAGKQANNGKSVLSALRINPRTKTRKALKTSSHANVVVYTVLSWDTVWNKIQPDKDISTSTMSDLLNYVNSREQFSFFTANSVLTDVSGRKNREGTELPLVKANAHTVCAVFKIPVGELQWIDPAPYKEGDSESVDLVSKKTVMSKYLGNKLWVLDTYNMTKASSVEIFKVNGASLQTITPSTWKNFVGEQSTAKPVTMDNLKTIHKEVVSKLTALKEPQFN